MDGPKTNLVRCFHGTRFGQEVLDAGRFIDVDLHNPEGHGVWLTTFEPSQPDDAPGDWLFVLDIPEDVIEPYEWITEGAPEGGPREFVVPADIVNAHCKLKLHDDELDDPDTDEMIDEGEGDPNADSD